MVALLGAVGLPGGGAILSGEVIHNSLIIKGPENKTVNNNNIKEANYQVHPTDKIDVNWTQLVSLLLNR